MRLHSYRTAAAAAKSLQSCLTLCDPIDGSPPGSPIPGILQARTLEWVAISFSNAWKWKVKVKSLSHVRLLATPWTAAYQAPPSMGFSRQEYWSGVPLPSLSSYTAFLKYPNNGLFRHSPLPPPKSTCCMELSLVSCHLEQFPSLFTSLSWHWQFLSSGQWFRRISERFWHTAKVKNSLETSLERSQVNELKGRPRAKTETQELHENWKEVRRVVKKGGGWADWMA